MTDHVSCRVNNPENANMIIKTLNMVFSLPKSGSTDPAAGMHPSRLSSSFGYCLKSSTNQTRFAPSFEELRYQIDCDHSE